MRLIGMLITLAVIAYLTYHYMGASDNKATPEQATQYIDQAKQNTEAINDAIKKQQELLRKAQQ